MAVNDKERRFSLLEVSGYSLALAIVVLFAIVYGLRFYQLDRWKAYFFGDSISAGDNCVVQAVTSSDKNFPADLVTSAPRHMVNVPHDVGFFDRVIAKKEDYLHASYDCTLATDIIQQERGLSYLHTGWIFAEHATVLVNGSRRVEVTEIEKPAVPLLADDLKDPQLRLRIEVSGSSHTKFGMSGLAPMVVATGTNKNFRIFGVETAINLVSRLFGVLPQLTLGLVLVFGWLNGSRSRLTVVTFFYFVMSSIAGVISMVSDYLPFDLNTSYYLMWPFRTASWLAFLVFGFEVLQYRRQWVPRGIAMIVAAVACMVMGVFLAEDPRGLQTTIYQITQFIMISGTAWLSYLGYSFLKSGKGYESRGVVCGFLSMSLSFFVFNSIDAVLYIAKQPVIFSTYIDLFLPLFVGWMLTYTLSQIEKIYQNEKFARLQMERDLELAHEIQDSMAPAKTFQVGILQGQALQIKHSQVAGDWLAMRDLPDGKVILITADATGKGVQAALVVHAVQSLWAESLSDTQFDAENFLQKVNRTLLKLGEKKPHSMTLGILILAGDALEYWDAGHVPVYVLQHEPAVQVKVLSGKGSVLGLQEKVAFTAGHLTLPKEAAFSLFFGTDGVFHKGSRTGKRDLQALYDGLLLDPENTLKAIPASDDKSLFWLRCVS